MNDIHQAVTILNQGGIIIFPTDTAFGIGCRIDQEAAIARLFKIRHRPETQATPVLVSDLGMAQKYWQHLTPEIIVLTKTYWPGGLTIIYNCHPEKVPALVRGNGATLGIRQPNYPLIQQLIAEVGVPILGPSANFHTLPTPYNEEDLDPQLVKTVDYVLSGTCLSQLTSTVIDCSHLPWSIKRQGAVSIDRQKFRYV